MEHSLAKVALCFMLEGMVDVRPHVPTVAPDFIAGLDLAITKPLNLAPDLRQQLATYAAEHMFPLIHQLGNETWHRGKFCLPTIDIPGPAGSFYVHYHDCPASLSEGVFRTTVQAPERPEELYARNQRLGIITTRLVVAHNDSMVAFYALEDGTTACKNDDPTGIPRLLSDANDLFEPLPKHIYAAGNPALWLARLAQRNTLATIQAELAAKPAVR